MSLEIWVRDQRQVKTIEHNAKKDETRQDTRQKRTRHKARIDKTQDKTQDKKRCCTRQDRDKTDTYGIRVRKPGISDIRKWRQ